MIPSMAEKNRSRLEGVHADEDEFQARVAEQIALTNSERLAKGLAVLSENEVAYFTSLYKALDQNKAEGSVLESFDKHGFGFEDQIDDENGNSESEGGMSKRQRRHDQRRRRGREDEEMELTICSVGNGKKN
jgi:hypothetical protein